MIPVNFAGKTGALYVHVIPGSTPFLFPRPLMEKFGLVIDFGRKRLNWGDNRAWTTVRQKGHQGHYLLDLAEDAQALRKNLRAPQFVYIPEDVDPKQAILLNEEEESEDEVADDTTTSQLKTLTPSKLRSICYAADEAGARLTQGLRPSRKPLLRRRRCWEVYVGMGLVSQYLRLCAVEVRQFGL